MVPPLSVDEALKTGHPRVEALPLRSPFRGGLALGVSLGLGLDGFFVRRHGVSLAIGWRRRNCILGLEPPDGVAHLRPIPHYPLTDLSFVGKKCERR